MDKNTLIAVVLSVVVITVGFIIQSVFFPRDISPQEITAAPVENDEPAPVPAPAPVMDSPAEPSGSEELAPAGSSEEEPIEYREYTLESNLYIARFSNRGGDLISLKLKEHNDGGEMLEMIQRYDTPNRACSIRFGGPNAPVVNTMFNAQKIGNKLEFSQTFTAPESGVPFTLSKIYTIEPDQYMIGLEVIIENSENAFPQLNKDGFAYTLEIGPQIGPKFEKLDGRREYRRYYTFSGDKRETVKIPKAGFISNNERINWGAIVGKYFAVAAVTDSTPYTVTFSNQKMEDIQDASRMFLSRPVIKSSMKSDLFRIYAGPKTPKDLKKYDTAEENSFGLADANLEELIDQGRILGWLEAILKIILELCYKLIHNYGVAIILLTIITKVILFPFTHKSYESTSKMQSLGPKVEEIKAKYKDNPNKMNASMAELYKKEGVNPLGGCLPILFQMPIFFALYGLLNKHFDLRGAMFIPGWITDLSAPESIYHLPFTIPILNWEDLRLLPIIYVFTQMLYTKLMSAGNTNTNSQMQMMTKMMPLMFFFILYNMPSGLVLYWIVSNILTALQQLYINRFVKKKAA